MIYVSPHAAELMRLATAVVRIEGGKVLASGGSELLAQAMAGPGASAAHCRREVGSPRRSATRLI